MKSSTTPTSSPFFGLELPAQRPIWPITEERLPQDSRNAAQQPQVVVFSARAMACCMAETLHHGRNETGGILLGHRCGRVWFVVEVVDPGPASIHRPAYFEYDQGYVNHLVNKLRWYYQKPLDLLGMWHRHPGSLDSFSGTDRETNRRFLRQAPQGILSAIMNIDPQMRMTVYHINQDGEERKLPTAGGDAFIPPGLLALRQQATVAGIARLLQRALRDEVSLSQQTEQPILDLDYTLQQTEQDVEWLRSLCGTLHLALDADALVLREEVGVAKREIFRCCGAPCHCQLLLRDNRYAYTPGILQRVLLRLYLQYAV